MVTGLRQRTFRGGGTGPADAVALRSAGPIDKRVGIPREACPCAMAVTGNEDICFFCRVTLERTRTSARHEKYLCEEKAFQPSRAAAPVEEG